MAKLVYWVSECLDDHPCYSIIGKTKKSVIAQLKQQGHLETLGADGAPYARPVKKEIPYRDAFDLFEWVTGEGGGRV